ncbi:Polymerase nucleotidyl transferase domain-containing protein [Madurella fahalii]|uniref:Polymerase nucleotidyl transferase domain-containing protein n=1 Tax=Madurella fahalii TaxID=1157608 RepID=A0ABQ0G0D2_9PEZI
MGGSAFSSLPEAPYTPRMPPPVYQHAKSACHAALRELFVCVATPIEGPAKKDHGDIDILVALERRVIFPQSPVHDRAPTSPHELVADIKHLLKAEYAIVPPAGTSANLAIRWPSELDHLAAATGDEGAEPKPKYIQVDVRICRDVDQLCWILFKHAHGDIWNLIGSTIRPFGLTVDEEALWIRIPEIESNNRNLSKVLLTRDPVEILHFLGLAVEGFWEEPLDSVEALFDYVTTSRLFFVQPVPEGDAEGDTDGAGLVGGEEGRKKLRANDRRRMKGRPIYRRWINEFVPQLRTQGKFVREGPGTSVSQVRAAIREEAFARFFVEAEYMSRLRDWQLKRAAEEMKTLIKSWIPDALEPQRRSCLTSAMLRIVMEDDLSFGIAPPGPFRGEDGFYNKETARRFVQENWQQVGGIEWKRQNERARDAMQLKARSGKK